MGRKLILCALALLSFVKVAHCRDRLYTNPQPGDVDWESQELTSTIGAVTWTYALTTFYAEAPLEPTSPTDDIIGFPPEPELVVSHKDAVILDVSFPDDVEELTFPLELGGGAVYGADWQWRRNEVPASILKIKKVTFPEGLQYNFNLSGWKGLISVGLPSTVTEIGGFDGCENLTDIAIPPSVISISADAFRGTPIVDDCQSKVVVKDGCLLTIKDAENFTQEEYDVQVAQRKDIRVIADGVLNLDCEDYDWKILDIVIPEGVVAIGERAFSSYLDTIFFDSYEEVLSCVELCDKVSVTLPSSLRQIFDNAFSYLNISSIEFGNEYLSLAKGSFSLTSGNSAFNYCPIKEITTHNLRTVTEWLKPDCDSLDGMVFNPVLENLERVYVDTVQDKDELSYFFLKYWILWDEVYRNDSHYGYGGSDGEWEWPRPQIIALDDSGSSADVPSVTNVVFVTVTNAIVHYIQHVVTTENPQPAVKDSIVELVTEIKSDGEIPVPNGWSVAYYKDFCAKFGGDYSKALMAKSGKQDSSGNDLYVWQDLVAGTNPLDENDKFRAYVKIVDGTPIISYSPELSAEEKAKRIYTTYGKKSLTESEWSVVEEDETANYNFFKVSVQMK